MEEVKVKSSKKKHKNRNSSFYLHKTKAGVSNNDDLESVTQDKILHSEDAVDAIEINENENCDGVSEKPTASLNKQPSKQTLSAAFTLASMSSSVEATREHETVSQCGKTVCSEINENSDKTVVPGEVNDTKNYEIKPDSPSGDISSNLQPLPQHLQNIAFDIQSHFASILLTSSHSLSETTNPISDGTLMEHSHAQNDTSESSQSIEQNVFLKQVYSDFKNIEYCSNMAEIVATQAAVRSYVDDHLCKAVKCAEEGNDEFVKFISDLSNYSLFGMVDEFRRFREASTKLHSQMKRLDRNLTGQQGQLWDSVFKEMSVKGKCHDGYPVNITHTYVVKEFDHQALDEMEREFKLLEEDIAGNAFNIYSEKLLYMKIEQYLYDEFFRPQLYDEEVQVFEIDKNTLKKCISILFIYQQQFVRDKHFLKLCQAWLTSLVALLMNVGTSDDYLFITNNVLRCPNGVSTWAAPFVQTPIPEICESESRFDSLYVQHALAVLHMILYPYAHKCNLPINVTYLESVNCDPSDNNFVILDSEGEEDDSYEMPKDWTEEDVISVLHQIPVTNLLDYVLSISTSGGNNESKVITEEEMLRLIALSTALNDIYLIGLSSYCSATYVHLIEHLCNLTRHVVNYVSDIWKKFISVNSSCKPALQVQYDRFVFRAAYKMFCFQHFGVWKFLSLLPYNLVSKKMMWTIIWSYHCPVSSEDTIYAEKDVDVKLQDEFIQAEFLQKVRSVEQSDAIYLLNALGKMAVASNSEKDFVCLIVHKIFQMSFVESDLFEFLGKEGTTVLNSIIRKYDFLISVLIREIGRREDSLAGRSLNLFKELNIDNWIPEKEDMNILSGWLLENALSTSRSLLARLIIKKLNWGFNSKGELFLPITIHRKVALLLLDAYTKFDSDGNQWLVSRGLSQLLQLYATITNSHCKEDQGFISWAWELLFSLKLHVLDQHSSPWIQIYDGSINENDILDIYHDPQFYPLLESYKNNHPAGCYLAIVMTGIGHSLKMLTKEGLQCFATLIECQQYAPAIHSLFYILPFFAKNSEQLLSNQKFITAMQDLIVADSTFFKLSLEPVLGAVINSIASMIKHQVQQACQLTIECACPLLKLWIKILVKLLSVSETKSLSSKFKHCTAQIYFLLDVVVKIAFLHPYARSEVEYYLESDICHSYVFPSKEQSSLWNLMFHNNGNSYSLLHNHSLPEYPWLAWYVILAESKSKASRDFWCKLQLQLAKSPKQSLSSCIKKVSSFCEIRVPPLGILPIYRWSLQISKTDVSNPALPLLWQQFFLYYLQRVHTVSGCKSFGEEYFISTAEQLVLKKMKSKLKEAESYYRNCAQQFNTMLQNPDATINTKSSSHKVETSDELKINESLGFYVKLSEAFCAFGLWINDSKLHSSSLCLSILEPKYCSDRLKLIIENDQTPWCDLVNMDHVKEDLRPKIHSWYDNKVGTELELNKAEVTDANSNENVIRHFHIYEASRPIIIESPIGVSITSVIDEKILASYEQLLKLMQSDQSVICSNAMYFIELMDKLKQLNSNLVNLAPSEYEKKETQITHKKACYKGSKRCSGAAVFSLQVPEYKINDRIQQKITSNRIDYHFIKESLSNFNMNELCRAAANTMNYVIMLLKKVESSKGEETEKYIKIGISLFYYEVKAIDDTLSSVENFSPSRHFFATCVELLGKEFIANREDQLLNLAKCILSYPTAGRLISHLFNPNNASPSVLINIYEVIAKSVGKCASSVILVLLSKINIEFWLMKKNVAFDKRKQVFHQIGKALNLCGGNPSEDVFPVYHLLKRDFSKLLLYMFPELYGEAVVFLLEGMENNNLYIDVWFETFRCFGCCELKDDSAFEEIKNSLQKFAANQSLTADQQLFVSSQPMTLEHVKETLNYLHNKYAERSKENNINLYDYYKNYIKVFSIFVAILEHSVIGMLTDESSGHANNSTDANEVWKIIFEPYSPWIHPSVNDEKIVFPYGIDEENDAKVMFQIFTMCIEYAHEKFQGTVPGQSILSSVWSYYLDTYVKNDARNYLMNVCHSAFLSLPWDQFCPSADDLEGMCDVLQKDLPESRAFLAEISLKIPWIQIMKKIVESHNAEYVGKTLAVLGKVLIISGCEFSIIKPNSYQIDLRGLEDLSWHYLSFKQEEELLDLFFSLSNPINLITNNSKSYDVIMLQLLKGICCLYPSISTRPTQSHLKPLLFLHKYVEFLTAAICENKNDVMKDPQKIKIIVPTLLTDIDTLLSKDIKLQNKMDCGLSLVHEVLPFLNNILDEKLQTVAFCSLTDWLNINCKSPLLLPCLKNACTLLHMNEKFVEIVECCILAHFNTEIQAPSDALKIWQLVSSCFQVPIMSYDEFFDASVKKNTYLTLYCYALHRIPQCTMFNAKTILLRRIIHWIQNTNLSESSEAKMLMLWDKLLELNCSLAAEKEFLVVQDSLTVFSRELKSLAEDFSGYGFLAAIGLAQNSNLSVNFRFICRAMSAYLLAQLPENGIVRIDATTPGYITINHNCTSIKQSCKDRQPCPSAECLKAMGKLKELLTHKPYLALKTQIEYAVSFILDPSHSLNNSRELLKHFALYLYPRESFLYALNEKI